VPGKPKKKPSKAELRRRAQKGWETRRKRERARKREEARRAKARSEAAKKGWVTRRKRAKVRSKAATKGWRTRKFRAARERAVNGLRGKKRADWQILVGLIENDDPVWLAFLAEAEKLGFTSYQARDEWFSPTIQ
jgi:hypothetical protein